MNPTKKAWLKGRVAKDLETIKIGVGATKHVGSDAYPYYVSEAKLLPNGWHVVGMYEPGAAFKGTWEEGTQVVEVFDPKHPTEFWLRLYRNNWYRCDKDGNLLEPHEKDNYSFGYAASYRDPSF